MEKSWIKPADPILPRPDPFDWIGGTEESIDGWPPIAIGKTGESIGGYDGL